MLDRELDQKGIYPPIAILPSLSRLMKDGVGKGFTREDHYDVSNQLFASYSKVQDARSLASVIGEDELSELDKQYLAFGDAFERRFRPPEPGGQPHHCGDAGPGVEAADHAAQGRAGPGGRQDHRGPLCGGGVEGAL